MKAGDIVLVKFPFSDLESAKKRPALILVQSQATSKIGVVTIAMITSKVEGLKFPGDFRISGWKKAGLLHPSLVRLAKVATVDLDIVDKVLGRLDANDLNGFQVLFQKQFKFWV
jgi:mRNA interferase MazF